MTIPTKHYKSFFNCVTSHIPTPSQKTDVNRQVVLGSATMSVELKSGYPIYQHCSFSVYSLALVNAEGDARHHITCY